MVGLKWGVAAVALAVFIGPGTSHAARVDVSASLAKAQRAEQRALLAEQRSLRSLERYIAQLEKKKIGHVISVKDEARIDKWFDRAAGRAGLESPPTLQLSAARILLEVNFAPVDAAPFVESPGLGIDPPVTDLPPVSNPAADVGVPAVVPVPMALWAGLPLLGAVGVTRTWRRYRTPAL